MILRYRSRAPGGVRDPSGQCLQSSDLQFLRIARLNPLKSSWIYLSVPFCRLKSLASQPSFRQDWIYWFSSLCSIETLHYPIKSCECEVFDSPAADKL